MASNPGYYKPDVCTSALTKLKGYLSTIGFGGKGALLSETRDQRCGSSSLESLRAS